MGSVIQLVAIACFLLIVASIFLAKKRKKQESKRKKQQLEMPKAIYDQVSFAQLKVNSTVDRDVTPFNTSIGFLFDVNDSTEVEGFLGQVRVPHIPRGTGRVSMFDEQRIVICLSQDRKTMLHQERDSDGRYWMYFMCSQNRTLEDSYEILLERARNAIAASPRRRAR